MARGDKNVYDKKKKGLPFVIFIATYGESDKVFENKSTGEKTTRRGTWRNQKYCRLNGLCVIDFDHVKGDVRKVWQEAYEKLSDEDKRRILFVFVTPSGQGLKVVFIADAAVGNLIDNQIAFSLKLGLNPDESCKDASRGAFLTTPEDIIFIDEERLINYQDDAFGEKYDEAYHQGESQPTVPRQLPQGGEKEPEACPRGDSEGAPITASPIRRLLRHGLATRRLSRATGIGQAWCWPITCDTSLTTTPC